MLKPVLALSVCFIAGYAASAGLSPSQQPTSAAPATPPAPAAAKQGTAPVKLGNFSVSLNVKNLPASKDFYEKLGFKMVFGNGKTMAIMQNDTATIGLFQGILDKNVLTFNPGWDRAMKTLPEFDDVRELQKTFKARGIEPNPGIPAEAEGGNGPAGFVVFDPDGNQILIDQHVPKPRQ